MQREDSDGFDDLLKDKTFCYTRRNVRDDCLRGVIFNFDVLEDLWDWSLKNCTNLELNGCVVASTQHRERYPT